MKAVVLTHYGDLDALQVREVPTPRPGTGQVLVRVESASVNYADIVRRRGDPYPLPTPLPAILGSEVAGTVDALGDGVAQLRPGDRVFALFDGHGLGGYAQYAVCDATGVFKLPDDVDLDVASTLVVAGVTAYQALKEAGRLQPGDSVFLPGAAGGVGSYAVPLAREFGARVIIGGASTPDRRAQVVARGADHAIDYTRADWPELVRSLTGGRGADVVLDMTGGSFFDQSLAALAPFGRLVTFATASRERSTLIAQRLMPLNQSVVGYYVSHWFNARPNASRAAFDALVERIADGRLAIDIAHRWPLERVADAHATMQSRQSTGKIVLKPWA